MRAKFKSELLSFEAVILYIVILLIIAFSIATIHSKKNKDEISQEVTTKAERMTISKTVSAEDTEEIEKEVVTVEERPELISLGEFRLTAYCKCTTCCGEWSNSPTASGVEPKVNHTIAVDTSVIPFGTKVMINGKTYTAEDTGSAIKGNRIDIYMSSHSEAMDFGVQYAEVFIVDRSE